MNPWYHLLVQLDKIHCNGPQKAPTDEYLTGLLCATATKNAEDAHSFIWFLNLASAYRDMVVQKTIENFDYRKIAIIDYWLMGCQGPFGNLLAKPSPSFPLLRYDEKQLKTLKHFLTFPQHDDYNCGPLWLLFILDWLVNMGDKELRLKDLKTPVTKVPNPTDDPHCQPIIIIPFDLGNGKTLLEPKEYEKLLQGQLEETEYETKLKKRIDGCCYLFRVETKALIERLRILYLASKARTELSKIQLDKDPSKIGKCAATANRILEKYSLKNVSFVVERADFQKESYVTKVKKLSCETRRSSVYSILRTFTNTKWIADLAMYRDPEKKKKWLSFFWKAD